MIKHRSQPPSRDASDAARALQLLIAVADLGSFTADDRRGLYASPSYLRRAHLPKTPEDLAGHAAITYSGESTSLSAARPRRLRDRQRARRA